MCVISLYMYIVIIQTLKQQLSSAVEDRQHLEMKAEKMIVEIRDMTEEARQIEEEILRYAQLYYRQYFCCWQQLLYVNILC